MKKEFPICPYCGKIHREKLEDKTKTIECGSCNKPYKLKVEKVELYESIPMESVLEHGGYIITQTQNKNYVLSKVISEYDKRSDAVDNLLDLILDKGKTKEKNKINTVKENKVTIRNNQTDTIKEIGKYF